MLPRRPSVGAGQNCFSPLDLDLEPVKQFRNAIRADRLALTPNLVDQHITSERIPRILTVVAIARPNSSSCPVQAVEAAALKTRTVVDVAAWVDTAGR